MLRSSILLLCGLLATSVLAAEPQIIRIKTLQAQMRYDIVEFTVAPGAEVKVVLENVDDMPHNIVFFQAGVDVVEASNKNMEKPEEALKRDWLPADPRMFAHSKMVQPKNSDEFTFKAPAKPGIYPYVCTFPGHALSMQGKMRVSAPGPTLKELRYSVYLGDWNKLPDFRTMKPHREGEVPDNQLQLKFDDYKNQYGVVFEGSLTAPKEAEYTFFLTSDDGARLFIDGQKVVDYDGIHPAGNIREGKVKLAAGVRAFRLEYFQGGGEAEIFAAWQGPGFMPTPLSKWVPASFAGGKGKKKDEVPPIPLTVGKEPVIYRNFISGAGTRAFGVGYPGGFNIAWSAAHTNLALVWRGAFIDAGKHWTNRGGGAQPPMGFDVVRPAGEASPALAVLASSSDPWPKGDPKEQLPGYQWKGYTLDTQRFPTFFYEWSGVQVSDRFDVEGDATKGGKLTRTLKLSGTIPANAYVRIATGVKVEAVGGVYVVNDGPINLDGRSFENHFTIAAEGAQLAGSNVLVPARSEIKVTYGWPGSHAQHAH